MPTLLLSTVIITFNEEKNLPRCLESLQGLSDEIIVVDSFSTDATSEICTKYGVTFIQNPFTGHIEQKNFALKQAKGQYILSIDADECLSAEMRESILKLKNSNFGHDGYRFSRRTRYVDHWVRFCGWYPDTKLRLIKNGTAQWGGDNPHDTLLPIPHSKIIKISGDLLHYSYHSVAEHVEQTNKFTTIAANSMHKNGKRSSNFKILSRPILQFVRDYFFKLGILDGRYGFTICYINGLSALLKYTKLKAIQDKKSLNRRASL
jgi:glycosyltransferase involved in cell wall biosynthesis